MKSSLFISIISIVLACGTNTNKNGNQTFKADLNPSKLSPFEFLEHFVLEGKAGSINVITCLDEFPDNWIKETDIDSLMTLIKSKDKAFCFLNPLSSYIPTTDTAQIGGYVTKFISSFRTKNKLQLGLWGCPKTDDKLADELIVWWNEERLRIKNK